MGKIGRNAPCPCGSGKKYKKCCLVKAKPPVDLLWRRLDKAHDDLVERLMTFAHASLGDKVLPVAADEFLLWPEDETLAEAIDGHLPLFMPWYLFNWVYDPEDADITLDMPADKPIAAIYLADNADRLDELQVRLAKAAKGKPFSFYEITARQPGHGFTLKDIFTGAENEVIERTASELLQVGDALFARVVTVDHVSILMGCSTIPIRPSWKPAIINLRKVMKDEASSIGDDTLEDYAMDLRELYFDFYDAAMQPPQMVNTDGESMAFHSLKYEKEPEEIWEQDEDDPEADFPPIPDEDWPDEDWKDSPGFRDHLIATTDSHWKGWIDEKIPALGGRSPRQAAKTADGRESVEALLLEARRVMEQGGMMALFDDDPIERVRRRLGLDRPQRSLSGSGGEAFEKICGIIASFGMRNDLEPVSASAARLCRRLENGEEFSLARGRPEIWAAAILYVVAQLNFIFDPDNAHHVTAEALCADLGTKQPTVYAKSLQIRRACDILFGDPDYSLPEIADMFSVYETEDGLIIPKSMVDQLATDDPFRLQGADDYEADAPPPSVPAENKNRPVSTRKSKSSPKDPPAGDKPSQLRLFDDD